MAIDKLIIKEWSDYISDLDNLNVEDWVWKQTERILNDLNIILNLQLSVKPI